MAFSGLEEKMSKLTKTLIDIHITSPKPEQYKQALDDSTQAIVTFISQNRSLLKDKKIALSAVGRAAAIAGPKVLKETGRPLVLHQKLTRDAIANAYSEKSASIKA